ncbi:MAG: hypothetical protein K2X81_18675, partial [Candidatus Obscuribacterales bacterium]|nr:hypothetical protein [Candidatus Obscuribacterales bacterium]
MDKEGRMVLYRPRNNDIVRATVSHEFSHALKNSSERIGSLYDQVIEMQNKQLPEMDFNNSSNSSEQWAELGEALLVGDPDLALLRAHENPVASSLFSVALRRSIETRRSSAQPLENSRLTNLLNKIDEYVRPRAQQQLNKMAELLGDEHNHLIAELQKTISN